MNLNQIVAFRAVMTSASLSQAARKIGRTQPAVSLAIRSLEETLGLKLFRRQGRELVPVPEAHYLHAEADGILERLATVSRTMKGLVDGEVGTLNVAAMPGPAAFLFPRFIASAVKGRTDITVSIASRSSTQVLELAGTQSIDFGFCDAPVAQGASAQYDAELLHARCFAAVPADHHLANADRVGLEALRDEPMGSLPRGHAHHDNTLAAFDAADVVYRKMADGQTFLQLLQFIRAGMCCAIVDPLTVITETEMDSTKGGVVFRPLREEIRYGYAIVWPRHRPLSQLAMSVRAEWRNLVIDRLETFDADPRTESVPVAENT